MAVVMQPIDASSGAPVYTAQQSRQAFGALAAWASSSRPLGARSGVRAGTPTTTATLSGAGSTTWTVGAHNGILDTQSPAGAGAYEYAADGTDTGVITAASGSIIRVDILYVAVNDTVQDGSGSRNGVIAYQAGTVANTAPTPTNPRAMVLAQITVPVSGGGAPTISWVAPWTTASGGIIPVTGSGAYPASPYFGQVIYDQTLHGPVHYNNVAWSPLPLGYSASGSGPTTLTVYTTTAGVGNTSVGLLQGRRYMVCVSINGVQVTNAATVTMTLNELLTGATLYAPLAPVVPAGSPYGFSVQVPYLVTAGTNTYQFYFTVTSSANQFRIAANGAQITVTDIGT